MSRQRATSDWGSESWALSLWCENDEVLYHHVRSLTHAVMVRVTDRVQQVNRLANLLCDSLLIANHEGLNNDLVMYGREGREAVVWADYAADLTDEWGEEE